MKNVEVFPAHLFPPLVNRLQKRRTIEDTIRVILAKIRVYPSRCSVKTIIRELTRSNTSE